MDKRNEKILEKRLSLLSNELGLIQNKAIKELIRKILILAPNYFWSIRSSNKGMHHPIDENRKEGLILHTKRVVYLANQLCRMENIKGIERDKLLGAMIIHDICSRGIENEPLSYSPNEHPFYIRKLTKNLNNLKHYDEIISIAEGHFGRWTPKEYRIKGNKLTKLGHIADYIASRKEIYIQID
ncbi:MAG: HD domain-containing protein [Candidatus Helarchaeota archaeon]